MIEFNGKIDANDLAYVTRLHGAPILAEPCPWRPGMKALPANVSRFRFAGGRVMDVFHVKPVYYQALNGTWRPLSEVTKYHGNKKIVLVDDWYNHIHPSYLRWLMKRCEVVGGRVRVTNPAVIPALALTLTAYPDPDPESATVDGLVVQSVGSTTWSTVRDDTTADSVNDSGTTASILVGLDGSNFVIQRYFALFDTSALTASATISAATMSLYYNGSKSDQDNDGDDYIAIVNTNTASNTALATGDLDDIRDINGDIPHAAAVDFQEQHDTGERKDLTGISTGYLDFALNATGISRISKTGITKFGACEGHDILDNQLASGANTYNYAVIACAETADTTSDPKLVVTYTVGSTSTSISSSPSSSISSSPSTSISSSISTSPSTSISSSISTSPSTSPSSSISSSPSPSPSTSSSISSSPSTSISSSISTSPSPSPSPSTSSSISSSPSSSPSSSVSSSPSSSPSSSASSSPSGSVSSSPSPSPSISTSSSISSSPSPSAESGIILGRNKDTGVLVGTRLLPKKV